MEHFQKHREPIIVICDRYSACKSLARQLDFIILAFCWAHVRRDFLDAEEKYNIRPMLLESFVQKDLFAGTCYKAANWIKVGETKGRGKLGPPGKISVPIKDIWVYSLDKNFRSILKN